LPVSKVKASSIVKANVDKDKDNATNIYHTPIAKETARNSHHPDSTHTYENAKAKDDAPYVNVSNSTHAYENLKTQDKAQAPPQNNSKSTYENLKTEDDPSDAYEFLGKIGDSQKAGKENLADEKDADIILDPQVDSS